MLVFLCQLYVSTSPLADCFLCGLWAVDTVEEKEGGDGSQYMNLHEQLGTMEAQESTVTVVMAERQSEGSVMGLLHITPPHLQHRGAKLWLLRHKSDGEASWWLVRRLLKPYTFTFPFTCTQRAYGSLIDDVYKHMDIIFTWACWKQLWSSWVFLFLSCSTSFDFSWEYIFFYVLAVLGEHELPTMEYIDSPPVYKSRSDQMVAGMMLALQQQQHFESMLQHSSKMNNCHEVFMWTHFESLIVEVYFSGKRQLSNGYSFAFLGLDLMHHSKKTVFTAVDTAQNVWDHFTFT